MPVIALLNQKGGVGKTTLSLHLAAALAMQGYKVLLVDADPQASALDWSAQRENGHTAALFPVIGLPTESLHRQIAQVGRDYEWTIIDGPPGTSKITRSAIGASDLVIIPLQPSPYDIWAVAEFEQLIDEYSTLKPDLLVRLLVNRLIPLTTLGREVQEEIGKRQFLAFGAMIRNRTEYAKAARRGMTALETAPHGAAANDILFWALETLGCFPAKKESNATAIA